MAADFFGSSRRRPPWDIGEPQPAFIDLLDPAAVVSPVLDVGCGTGDLAVHLGRQGHEVLGVDRAAKPLDRARAKARAANARAEFLALDAFELPTLGRRFATVVDSGFFHSLPADDRGRFVDVLSAVLDPAGRYFVLGFAVNVPVPGAPRAISATELRRRFGNGWSVESVRPARFVTAWAPAGVPAIFATLRRES